MFQNNIYKMYFNQVNPIFNYNQINPMMMMMNNEEQNQMNNIPYNQMNQILMNNIMLQNHINNNNIQYNNQKEEDMYIFNMPKEYYEIYDKSLYNISDQKIKLYFKEVTTNKMVNKTFPIYFIKNELYSYIKGANGRKTVLFYDNNIINNDESSIEDIPDNSIILLFNQRSFNNFRNSSLYKYIINLFPSRDKLNLFTNDPKGESLFCIS